MKGGPRVRVGGSVGSAKVRVRGWVMDYVNISPQNVRCVLVLRPPSVSMCSSHPSSFLGLSATNCLSNHVAVSINTLD